MSSLWDWVMRGGFRECYRYVVPYGTHGVYWSTLIKREDMTLPPLIMRRM